MLTAAQAAAWAAWAEWICNPFDSVEVDQEAPLMRGFLLVPGVRRHIGCAYAHAENETICTRAVSTARRRQILIAENTLPQALL